MGCCTSLPEVEEKLHNTAEEDHIQDGFKGLSWVAEAKADALLAIVPGRLFANGASDNACVFTQQGRKGTNQDAMLVWEDFSSVEDTVFCGVFDGHGPYGHLVARRVRDSMPLKLVHYWQEELAQQYSNDMDGRIGLYPSTETEMPANTNNGKADIRNQYIRPSEGSQSDEHGMFGPWKEAHMAAYRVMDKELRAHPGIDCFCSGTTAVTVLKQGKHLVIGNVGDSRAIMGSKDKNGTYYAVQLTVDLKPNLPREAERIRQCRGRVFALPDEPEVARVWLPYDDSPGLAMARAFGDFCLKDYGVIAVPEMSYRQLTEQDQFIVLATDGIWDVLSNDDVVEVIAHAPSRDTAARALVESAVSMWRLKYPTSKVDDCAVVCLYLDQTFWTPEHNVKSEENSPMERKYPISRLQNKRTSTSQLSSSRGREEISNNYEAPTHAERMQTKLPRRKLSDWLDAADAEEEEWSALDGVTRVNSLLNLPRHAGETSRQRHL